MNPLKREISRLEALPRDLLGDIIAKLASRSAEDFARCTLSCKELKASSDDYRVFKALNLASLVKKPLASTKYVPLMSKCLAQNNPDGHYIQGIVEYFHKKNSPSGLLHLSIAADAGKEEAIYLYAVLLMCRGELVKGKTYFQQLKWQENKTTTDTCWTNIKATLHDIRISRKKCYIKSLEKMYPTASCDLYDFENMCVSCFHFKRMAMFIFKL